MVLLALEAGLVATLPAPSASAASNGLWSVFPTVPTGQVATRPYFQPVLTPGVAYKDSVTIINQSSVSQSFNIYGADAFNTATGAFSLRRRTDPKVGIGAWIQLPLSTVRLPPLREVSVPFTINTPADASAGDHDGGIVAESTNGVVEKSGAVHVTVLQAVGVRIYGTVRGPMSPGLAVSSLSVQTHRSFGTQFGGPVSGEVSLTVTNTGNTNLTPQAKLSVSSSLGHRVALPSVSLPELVPQGSATVSVPFPRLIPFGRVSAHVAASASGVNATATSGTFVVPWLFLLILVAIAAVSWSWRRRRPHVPPTAEQFFAAERHAPRKAHVIRA